MEGDVAIGTTGTQVDSSSTGVQQHDSPGDVLASLNPTQLKTWRATGKLPGDAAEGENSPAPKKDAATEGAGEGDGKPESSTGAPAKAEGAAEGKQPEGKTPESAAGGKTQGKEDLTPAQARILELLADKKVLERDLAEARRTKPAEAAPAPVKVEEAKPPRAEDYENVDEYVQAAVDYGVKKAVAAELSNRDKAVAAKTQETQLSEAAQQWHDRCEAARTKYPDFDTVALDEKLPVLQGSVLDIWVFKSDLGTDLLYHYGKHPDELRALNTMHPVDAAKELTKLEGTLGGTAKPTKPAPAKVTQAPKPPSEVSATATPSDDPVAAAIASGDAGAYMRLQNAKELKK